MAPVDPTLALAVSPRVLRDALVRVLGGRGFDIVVLDDAGRGPAERYDVVVTDAPDAERYECDVLIDVSGDAAEAHDRRTASRSVLGSVGDVMSWMDRTASTAGVRRWTSSSG